MSLKYKIVSTVKPGSEDMSDRIYFPKLCGQSQVDLDYIVKILELRSTASPGDVYLIIQGLVNLIPQLLADGHTIKLNNLGIFRLLAKTNASPSAEEVSAKNIKQLRLSFIPDKNIRKQLEKIVPKREK